MTFTVGGILPHKFSGIVWHFVQLLWGQKSKSEFILGVHILWTFCLFCPIFLRCIPSINQLISQKNNYLHKVA